MEKQCLVIQVGRIEEESAVVIKNNVEVTHSVTSFLGLFW
jgi:hypothetical protein